MPSPYYYHFPYTECSARSVHAFDAYPFHNEGAAQHCVAGDAQFPRFITGEFTDRVQASQGHLKNQQVTNMVQCFAGVGCVAMTPAEVQQKQQQFIMR